ncbi:hypothetical protein SDRG_08205 [Saprolegnia diclina VS20]|uniref:F-box domain-containing protein n=1 Tax=Saprolegnia diclina (strain VS20) TaxID=1156394 RepID=T0QI78_SAPDV|nr:hypothetical protein SDRG_08205 [Saprolegnia diclina VS20]EQC34436.1 hypothetical protein SDRG_08205 [Saprolegnia diclina VS20]|eukprot:XP_008612298.1 hypothetical protein SDRG_08205 [Saprolegnia diclina VS20]
MAKRVQRAATHWTLSSIVLHVARYVYVQADVVAFLRALASYAHDEHLRALLTLLEAKPGLWPRADVDDLSAMHRPTVLQALPALCKIYAHQSVGADFCHGTPLPPTADVHAYATDVYQLGADFGPWVPNIVKLHTGVHCDTAPLDVPRLQPVLASCPKLLVLSIKFADAVDKATMDTLLAAVVAACPRLSKLRFQAVPFVLESCESLLTWVKRPRARTLRLTGVDFSAAAATTLARALLSSPTLRSVALEHTKNLSQALLDPSTLPLEGHLRHLVINANHVAMDATFPVSLTTMDVRCATLIDIVPPRLPEYISFFRVKMSDAAFTMLCGILGSSKTLARLDVAHAELRPNQVAKLIKTLPLWLNRQNHACAVRLGVTSALDVERLITAMTRMRILHKVKIELYDNEALNKAACKRLVTALWATSSVALRFESLFWDPTVEIDLQAHATRCNVRHSDGWYRLPL